MKQGRFMAICLILFVCFSAASLWSDESTVDYESFVLENFDGDSHHEWVVEGKTYSYDFEWRLSASKFATKNDDDSFPKMTYVASWPMALFGTNREGKDIKSFGIWGNFDRRGYNWIDVYPVKAGDGDGAGEPFEIPIPGRVSYLDLWVWGSNLNYYIEVYLRDYSGVVHNVYLGNIAYQGWKNLRARIPGSIRQAKRILPKLAALSFVKFRVWTTPRENVNNFYIYLDQFKILTDTFESLFDGDELADPDRVQEFWNASSN